MRAYFSLNAFSPNKKILRYYCLLLAPDLFGGLLLTTYHGGIGKQGRYRQLFCKELVDINRSIRVKLSKRLYADKRIGCNYTLKKYNGDQDFEDKVLYGKLKELINKHYSYC